MYGRVLEGKIKHLFNCFPIEIKVKYGVGALASRAVMTDFIHLFVLLEALTAIQRQNQKENKKDPPLEGRKLQCERKQSTLDFCCLLQESHFTAGETRICHGPACKNEKKKGQPLELWV